MGFLFNRDPDRSGGRRRLVLFPLIVAVGVVAFQYFSSEKFVNPETGKAAHVALNSDQEAALGWQSYQEVLASSRVVKAGPEVEMVQRVARRLAAATGPAGARFDWQVSVVDEPQVNAFCLPGGKIVVYTGILGLARHEAGLATVIGHEIAHATSRHGSQRLLQGKLANTILAGANVAVGLGDMSPEQKQMVLGALGAGAKFGVILPFSRSHEVEADEIGLLYMARAGYDPREAIAFWERMEAASKGAPPEFASTHPSHATRIERLRALLPRALEESARAPGPRGER